MKPGFILPLVLLILLAIVGYFVYTNSTVTPSQLTIETARTIVKYPNSHSWEIKADTSICPFRISDCNKPPVNIKFSSTDAWAAIYGYYVNGLKDSDWQTNTYIVTSIPTSVVFTSDTNCEATLKQDSKFTGDLNPGQYLFTINCP